MKKLIPLIFVAFVSCASSNVVKTEDITNRTEWLESTDDNPIINVIQKQYSNNDIEIVIKKKLTTDYVTIRLRGGKKIISKTTEPNG